jgi:hypothetical protein
MKRLVLFLLTLILATAATASPAAVRKFELLSDLYTIEKKYRSMEGPQSMEKVTLMEGPPQLLWIVGVKTEMVEEDGKTPQLPELMCHVNIDLDSELHRTLFNFDRGVASRLITLSQGITETRVPDGFGFPIISTEPLLIYTQVLNHNIKEPKDLKVRHKVTVDYIRDSDLERPIKPLMNLGASGMVVLDESPLAIVPKMDLTAGAATGHHGGGSDDATASCLLLHRAPNATGTSSDYVDPEGRKMTGHWIVPPGRQVNHSDITWFMSLPFDTKLHYAAVHLHPFAESLTLRDVTADKTIFTAKAKNPEGRIGLDHVDTFISTKGVKLYRDHKYELISVYNNPTQETHDSMASVFFGFSDSQFVKPKPAEIYERLVNLEDRLPADATILKTSVGDIAMRFERDAAAESAKQFARLLRNGVLNGSKLTKIAHEQGAVIVTFEAPLTADQKKLVRELPKEKGVIHEGAHLSFCPTDSKNFSFDLVIGRAPARDERCVAFASALTVAGSPALLQLRDNPTLDVEIKGGETISSQAQSAGRM